MQKLYTLCTAKEFKDWSKKKQVPAGRIFHEDMLVAESLCSGKATHMIGISINRFVQGRLEPVPDCTDELVRKRDKGATRATWMDSMAYFHAARYRWHISFHPGQDEVRAWDGRLGIFVNGLPE